MKYYVNRFANTEGQHEVHTFSCDLLPEPSNRLYLGEFTTCEQSLISARIRIAPRPVNGCKKCIPDCYKDK